MISNVTIETKDGSKATGGCGCGCGGHDSIPFLVASDLPKQIRHAAVIGALSSLQAGGQLDVQAPHKPMGLIRQLEEVAPGEFAVETIDDNPEAYVVRFTRK